jgi:outer membrane protein assembly factor BamB
VEGEVVFTNPGGGEDGSLAAFNKDSGALIWHSQKDGGGYSSPVAVTFGDVRQVLFLTNASLLGVEAQTGKLLWRYEWPCTANAATPIAITGHSKDGKPLLYVFISSSYGVGCALLKIEKNKESFDARPVYRGSAMCNHFSSSVRQGDYLYGFNEDRLTCLNLKTGKTTWQKSGFGKGSLLRVGNRLIVLAETSGKLALVKSDSKDFEELASFKPLSRRCWTVPVLINGRLLVRDEEKVKCFDLRAKHVAVQAKTGP